MNRKISKHWVVLIMCCCMSVSAIGCVVNVPGVYYTPVSESLGVLRGTFAMHVTILSFSAAITALFIPAVMQRFSFKKILITCAIITGCATMLMGVSTKMYQFYILSAIRGASYYMYALYPLTYIANRWFYKKCGLATSIIMSFAGVSGAVLSPILSACIEAFGWQMTYVINGLIILAFAIPPILYPFTVDPKDSGLEPYGYEEKPVVKSASAVKNTNTKFSVMQAPVIMFVVYAILNTAIVGSAQHLSGYVVSVGFTSALGAAMISAAMIGNIVSKLFIGMLTDKLGAVKAEIVMMFVNAVGLVILIFAATSILMLSGAFLFGAIYSSVAVGHALLTKQFFGLENYSKVFPMISFATGVGVAVTSSLVGYVYDFTGSYVPAFWGSICIGALNLVLLLIISRTKLVRSRAEAK